MKIIFICPYFGCLPNHFDLWLKSCAFNQDINWMIFTDDKSSHDYPTNVTVKYLSFKEFKTLTQSKFDFKISLEGAYKLCDFKPTYGYIFEDMIKDYDFWGYCDLDSIFGDIRKFITDNILNNYEKILASGQMTLFRNNYEVNRRFMTPIQRNLSSGESKPLGDLITYKDILSEKSNFFFDEWNPIFWNRIYDHNINYIYEYLNIPFYTLYESIGDIYALEYRFLLVENYSKDQGYLVNHDIKHQVFIWDKGRLNRQYLSENKIMEQEFMYVHLQKRDMEVNISDVESCDSFLIIPNSFNDISNDLTEQDIMKYSENKIKNYNKFDSRFWEDQVKENIQFLRKKFPQGVFV